MTREHVVLAAKLLNIEIRGKVIWIDHEEENDFIMDFALYPPLYAGQSFLQTYIQQAEEPFTETQKEIVTALQASYTSLFRVTGVYLDQRVVQLENILNPDMTTVLITDLGYSQTAIVGNLVFTRIITLDACQMTSGVAFHFHANKESSILSRYPKLMKKIKHPEHSVRLFSAFFTLNQTDGLPILLEIV